MPGKNQWLSFGSFLENFESRLLLLKKKSGSETPLIVMSMVLLNQLHQNPECSQLPSEACPIILQMTHRVASPSD